MYIVSKSILLGVNSLRNRKLGIDYSSDDFEGCPVETTLDIIGGKWKGILLYHLIDGKRGLMSFENYTQKLPSVCSRYN